MPFRNDLDALAARQAALDAEIAAKSREREEVARALEHARMRDLQRDWGPQGRERRRLEGVVTLVLLGTLIFGIAFAAFSAYGRTSREEMVRERMERLIERMDALGARPIAR